MKIGIDLGGSHIAIAEICKNGNLENLQEIDIKDTSNTEQFIKENIVNIIAKNFEIRNIEKIGISAPGLIQNGEIIYAKNLNLNNYKIVDILKEYYNIPITLKNDAKCAALAEKKYGSLKKYENAVFINIGTGIGGAAFINGNLLQAKEFPAFEFGHTIINQNGKKCSCGNQGCFEAEAAITALKNMIKQKLNIKQELTGKELLQIIKENESQLADIIDNYIIKLSIGIQNIINIFEPEAVALGGSFVYYQDIFLDKLKQNIKPFNNKIAPEILLASLKNEAGIIGAII